MMPWGADQILAGRSRVGDFDAQAVRRAMGSAERVEMVITGRDGHVFRYGIQRPKRGRLAVSTAVEVDEPEEEYGRLVPSTRKRHIWTVEST